MTTKKLPPAVWLLAVLATILAACSDQPKYTIGNPEPEGRIVQDTNPGRISLTYTRYADTYVGIDAEYARVLVNTPEEGYKCLVVKHAYGSFYVLVREGLYEEELAKFKPGQIIRLYGRVAAKKLPTDAAPKISIVIDQ